MTRQQELEIIEKTRALFNDEAQLSQIREWFDANFSESFKLQQQGLHFDALAELPEVSKKMQQSWGGGTECVVLLQAALIRCMAKFCPHIPEKTQPFHVFLAARVVSCKDCILTFFDHFQECDTKRLGSDECDLCLKEKVKTFHKFTTVWNGLLFYGDCCPECVRLFATKE